jgi:DoxX-like family
MKKSLHIAGYVLHGLFAAAFLLAGGMKLMPLSDEMVQEMAKNGLTPDWVRVIGVGEISTAILLVIPRTFSLGLLLASGLCGGIIATLMTHGQPIVPGVVLLVVAWVGALLRDCRTFFSFHPKKGTST